MEHQPRTSRLPAPTGGSHPAAVVADPAVPGTVLGGRYRVGECLGAGAMGVVWSAFDRRLRRTVAVKQLVQRRRGAYDATQVRLARVRAMREGRIAARVVHPRAIAVFDAVEHAGSTWLVMEYLPSRSLATVLAEQGPLEPAVVAHVGAQIADALAAVHEAGIVHGDVKPGNVLITDDGVAKITDFGVSRAVWDTSTTGGDTVAGTPGYFAPEVARGGEPTPASDVFSLGATLYAAVENELVCGPQDNTLAVLHAMAEGRLRPATRAGVLGRPLAAMLRRDPEHRPEPAAVRRALRSRAPAQAPGFARPLPEDAPLDDPPLDDAPALDVPIEDLPPEVVLPAPRREGEGQATVAAPASRPAVPTPDPAPGPAPRPPRHRRRVLAVAAATAVALGAAAGVAVALGTGPAELAAPQAAPVAPVAPVSPVAPGAPTPASPAPASEEPPSPGAPVGDAEAAAAVTAYYGGLPGELDRSWATLTGPARADSGGYGGYRRFWERISSVSASGVTAADGSVSADIEFVTDQGVVSRERYRLEVGRDDRGQVVITSAQRAADAS